VQQLDGPAIHAIFQPFGDSGAVSLVSLRSPFYFTASLTRKSSELLLFPLPDQNRRRDTSRTTRGAGNHFPSRHVPGRGEDSAAHTQAELSCQVRIQTCACYFERIGSRLAVQYLLVDCVDEYRYRQY
jgi:hypothetical protein